MNSKQSNKLASFTATESVLKANPEIVNVPGLPALVAMLTAKVGEINRLAKTQTQPVQVRTTERDQILESMTEMTLEMAGFVRSLAREMQLPQLAQSVQMGMGSFRRARRSHRVWFAQRVLDAAQSVLPQLGAFGVTAETLATLQARIEAATQRVNLPRETVAAKKAATQQLVALFAEVNSLLGDGIDPLVFPLRKTSPEFHAAYRAARSVVDLPGSRNTAETEKPPLASVPAASSTSTTPPSGEKQAA